ncbi:hypothetical protein PR048_029643 [Dryococelus australis]|uniref:Reverse transcriptase domain-containing protein n=1 Tax=Dryococelus australis TaxID=614101 RepID=A0ABQ9GDZ3_9NEOP|nr:hypothetical protein PR048_029643 [Dryococelus australis]
MHRYADVNRALVVCCHNGRRRLGQPSPGGVKRRVDQWLKGRKEGTRVTLRENIRGRIVEVIANGASSPCRGGMLHPLEDSTQLHRREMSPGHFTSGNVSGLRGIEYPRGDIFHNVIRRSSERDLYTRLIGGGHVEKRGLEQRRNERAGETGYPRENPPTSVIVRHDIHIHSMEIIPHTRNVVYRAQREEITRIACTNGNLFVVDAKQSRLATFVLKKTQLNFPLNLSLEIVKFSLLITSHQADNVPTAGAELVYLPTRLLWCQRAGTFVIRILILRRRLRTSVRKRGRSSISAFRNRAGRCRWSADFLGDLPFLPPFHSGTAPNSSRFTLMGSQDLATHSANPDSSFRENQLTPTVRRPTKTNPQTNHQTIHHGVISPSSPPFWEFYPFPTPRTSPFLIPTASLRPGREVNSLRGCLSWLYGKPSRVSSPANDIERGHAVVTHWTRIRKYPGSIPGSTIFEKLVPSLMTSLTTRPSLEQCMNKVMRPMAMFILHKAEDYRMSIQVDLKQGFQKCSCYCEQPILKLLARGTQLQVGLMSLAVENSLEMYLCGTTPVLHMLKGQPVAHLVVTVNQEGGESLGSPGVCGVDAGCRDRRMRC